MNHIKGEVLQKYLLAWYDAHARSLPWRDEPAPYRVWVSEIMLQQTRVDTVIPYFERFVHELPTVEALAFAEEPQLLKLWEGLGYYHRVRNLKKAAQTIQEQFDGVIPSTAEQLETLPGIGHYSAGAIASIAHGERVPAIDGNVLRVFARITANYGGLGQSAVKKEIEEYVCSVLPAERNGDFNQALMELGALICLPNGEPKCGECPLNTLCEACLRGITKELPVKAKKSKRRIETLTVFVILCGGRAAIRKRPDDGLLAGMWELPHAEGELTPEQSMKVLEGWGIHTVRIEPLKRAKHIFSHIEWHMTGYRVLVEDAGTDRSAGGEMLRENGLLWITPEELSSEYALPSAFKAYRNLMG